MNVRQEPYLVAEFEYSRQKELNRGRLEGEKMRKKGQKDDSESESGESGDSVRAELELLK